MQAEFVDSVLVLHCPGLERALQRIYHVITDVTCNRISLALCAVIGLDNLVRLVPVNF
jgi:hypothetical protein